MSCDLTNKTVLVYDHGCSVALAIRLAREFGRVMYFKPWKESDSVSSLKMIGTGYEGVEVPEHFFDVVDEVDLFVFPHIYDGDLQKDLVSRGKRVWGSRHGDIYELDRMKFKNGLKQVGLSVVPFHRCTGTDELREYLRENEDKWVKTDMRGDGETWHHTNYRLSRAKLDAMDYQYGPFKDMVGFVVDDSIDSIVEVAYDGFMITSPDGMPKFPELGFTGYEDKNLSHIVACSKYGQMSDIVRDVNDRFAPLLTPHEYRGAWGTEIKVTDEGYFFIDATCRQPSPPGQVIMELVGNLGELFYHGADGEVVDLEIEDEVGVQVQLQSDWAGTNHEPVEVPEEIEQWVKLEECYRDHDGVQWIIPRVVSDPIIGWRKIVGSVVATASDIASAIELVSERCEQIKSFDTKVQLSSLRECLKRIEEGNQEGVKFPVTAPEPEEVLEEK